MADWFRSRAWSPERRDAFFKRLNRVRKPGAQAQYVRIQAYYLFDRRSPRKLQAALELLDDLFTKYPDPAELAAGFLLRADCLVALGRDEEALSAFRQAVQTELDEPTYHCFAWLHFGWFVVERSLGDRYLEVRKLLATYRKEYGDLLIKHKYMFNAIAALLAHDQGKRARARIHAARALALAKEKHSGFAYHPTVGLVQNTKNSVHARLEKFVPKSARKKDS